MHLCHGLHRLTHLHDITCPYCGFQPRKARLVPLSQLASAGTRDHRYDKLCMACRCSDSQTDSISQLRGHPDDSSEPHNHVAAEVQGRHHHICCCESLCSCLQLYRQVVLDATWPDMPVFSTTSLLQCVHTFDADKPAATSGLSISWVLGTFA